MAELFISSVALCSEDSGIALTVAGILIVPVACCDTSSFLEGLIPSVFTWSPVIPISQDSCVLHEINAGTNDELTKPTQTSLVA